MNVFRVLGAAIQERGCVSQGEEDGERKKCGMLHFQISKDCCNENRKLFLLSFGERKVMKLQNTI